ncbi:hypothetical protein ARMGADRAFT_1038662 [Armillaria gallica]|uniref:Uncharacterized protein n=1 Tax=Armillaria gallica TaxID=47427 RepID=A0A2H3CLU1_ARMGA|nr:hypothetical protein ARMGADRAFT_1038662 [Armillaria gallica]
MPGWINFAVDGGNGNGWIEELERGRYSVAGEDKGCLRQFGYCGCEFVRLLGYRYRVVAVEGDVVEGGPGKSTRLAAEMQTIVLWTTMFLDYYALRDSPIRVLAKALIAQDTMIIFANARSW